MPDGLLIFIHEASWSCLESVSGGWPKASMRARVCRALLWAASAHTELLWLFLVLSVSLKSPVFVLCLEGKPLGFLGKTVLATPFQCVQPHAYPDVFCWTWLFWGFEHLWDSAGCMAPGWPLCIVWHVAASFELHPPPVVHKLLMFLKFNFFPPAFSLCEFITHTFFAHQSLSF